MLGVMIDFLRKKKEIVKNGGCKTQQNTMKTGWEDTVRSEKAEVKAC